MTYLNKQAVTDKLNNYLANLAFAGLKAIGERDHDALQDARAGFDGGKFLLDQISTGEFDVEIPQPAERPHAAEIAEQTDRVMAALATFFDEKTPKSFSVSRLQTSASSGTEP